MVLAASQHHSTRTIRPRPDEPTTRLTHVVARWAQTRPHQVCATFWLNGRIADRLTYGDLLAEYQRTARLFRDAGLAPGDSVVLFGQSCRYFLSGFLGIQHAGLLPVPCPPPERLENRTLVFSRLADMLRCCNPAAVYLPQPLAFENDLRSWLKPSGVRLLTPADLNPVLSPMDERVHALSYCQFTSGSGGRSKGVLLTHANVMASLRARIESHGLGENDAGVTWLPMAHNMGLCGLLTFLVTGSSCHVMPPYEFVTRPVSWLQLISDARASLSSGSNFAYALCARKAQAEEIARLDLSSWRVAICGGEKVTQEVVDLFCRTFAPCGFDRRAFLPAYGCSEDVMTATTRRPGQGPRFDLVCREAISARREAIPARAHAPAVAVASLGAPVPGQRVTAIGEDGAVLPERRVGEIALSGPALMQGYVGETTGGMNRRRDGWLMTGDLGYLADGELFIVGRKKELIIKGGRNYYPQDIEEAAGTVAGIRPGRVAAFAVPSATIERLVILAERVDAECGDTGALCRSIKNAVLEKAGIAVDEAVVVGPNALPLTPSGKLMRHQARDHYMQSRVTPQPEAEAFA